MTINIFDQQNDELEIQTTNDEQQILDTITTDSVHNDVHALNVKASMEYSQMLKGIDARFSQIHEDCESSDGITRHEVSEISSEYTLMSEEQISEMFASDESILESTESVSRRK